MFNTYEFTFAGESSLQHGLMVYDFGGTGQDPVAFGNRASIVESRSTNRIQPVHLGVNYHESPLEFKLVFGAEKPLDRYEMADISMWLTGHQDYQWLSIDQPDMANMEYRCLVTSLTPLHHGWIPYAFEASIQCDCPYAYSYPFEYKYTISGETNILFRNESTVWEYLKPELSIQPSAGTTEIKIVNHSDGDREFKLSNIPGSSNIYVDNNNGIIQELNYNHNLYGGFNMNFFRLVHGDNELTITGNGVVSIAGRFLYNVAG